MPARRTTIKRIDDDLVAVIKEVSRANKINETMASRLIAKQMKNRRLVDEIQF